MWKKLSKGGTATNQRAVTGALKRATFWMQEDTLKWIKAYAKVSGISQGALINAVLLDFQLRKLDPALTDPVKTARVRRYVDALLGLTPELEPSPAYMVSHHAPPRQFPKTPK